MPFLVDTATLTLSEMDLGVHLVIHPVVRIGRDAECGLTSIYSKKSKRGNLESVIQVQVDRRTAE